MRIAVAVLLGVTLVSALGVARVRSALAPTVATLQDSEWGDAHVTSHHKRAQLFPPQKHPRWESWAARTHAARDPMTGARRHPKLARE